METTLSQTSTTLLAGVAGGGNPHAERLFVQRYGPLAEAVARAAGLGSQDVEDVRQETVLAAVQGLRERRYERPRGPFKAWFRAILFHKIQHLRRDRARRPHVGGEALGGLADPSPGPAEAVEAAFEQEWARAMLAEAADEVRQRVEPVTWQAYDLVVNQNWKRGEVARVLGIKRTQVYNAVHRIQQHLVEAVEDLTAP